jgi:hypothetical protein
VRHRRLYWHDFETGRSGSSDVELPDGPLVEEIEAFEFYTREGHSLICGWPALHHEQGETICRCGFIFPQKVPTHWHTSDDEALQ